MKIAVIGSRTLQIDNMEDFLPPDVTEIISGGAKGIDACARAYAERHHITLTEYKPDYRRYGKGAPLKRNLEIARNADHVIAFWDGCSHGTKFVIDLCKKEHIPITVYHIKS